MKNSGRYLCLIPGLAPQRDSRRGRVEELTELMAELRVQLIGPIRQELLSGIKTKKQFSSLKKK
jgi:hypothetical protein